MVIPVGNLWQELKLLRKVKGKIVITDIIPVRFVPMLRDRKNKDGKETGVEVEAENLKKHVMALAKDIGERNFSQYQNLERAADYIKQEFKKFGY